MGSSSGAGTCAACGKPVQAIHRRCVSCGAWLRPWSVGGKPSRDARFKVGGAGRPEDWGGQTGTGSEAAGSVWVRYGKNSEFVRQSTPDGKPAPSGAHARAERERRERVRKRRSKS